jgi:hypothetical protein
MIICQNNITMCLLTSVCHLLESQLGEAVKRNCSHGALDTAHFIKKTLDASLSGIVILMSLTNQPGGRLSQLRNLLWARISRYLLLNLGNRNRTHHALNLFLGSSTFGPILVLSLPDLLAWHIYRPSY